jgi:hypothetical protein
MCECTPFDIEFVTVSVKERIEDLENFNMITCKISEVNKKNYKVSETNKNKRIRLF